MPRVSGTPAHNTSRRRFRKRKNSPECCSRRPIHEDGSCDSRRRTAQDVRAAYGRHRRSTVSCRSAEEWEGDIVVAKGQQRSNREKDRKSTRLNSSHRCISYAVFCLKKK